MSVSLRSPARYGTADRFWDRKACASVKKVVTRDAGSYEHAKLRCSAVKTLAGICTCMHVVAMSVVTPVNRLRVLRYRYDKIGYFQ